MLQLLLAPVQSSHISENNLHIWCGGNCWSDAIDSPNKDIFIYIYIDTGRTVVLLYMAFYPHWSCEYEVCWNTSKGLMHVSVSKQRKNSCLKRKCLPLICVQGSYSFSISFCSLTTIKCRLSGKKKTET